MKSQEFQSWVKLGHDVLVMAFIRNYAPKPIRLMVGSLVIILVALVAAIELAKRTSQTLPLVGAAEGSTAFATQIICAFIVVLIWLTLQRFPERDETADAGAETASTVHVLLPLSGTAPGDGLLQAAGVLAARDAYPDLEIVFHDTKATTTQARQTIDRLINDWTASDGPLWMIVTMSQVTRGLSEHVCAKLESKPGLKNRFSMIMTVSGSPDVQQAVDCGVIRYSIDGRQEAEKFVEFISSESNGMPLSVSLIGTESSYSMDTLEHLQAKLARLGNLTIRNFNHHDIVMTEDALDSVAVVVGYDLGLFNALKRLNHAGFRGRVLGSATLSVEDWKQYLHGSNILSPDIQYSALDYAAHATRDDQIFRETLEDWNFAAIINSECVYGKNAGAEALDNFNEVARQVYRRIDPNYISALCFDSVRAFDTLRRSQQQSLSSTPETLTMMTENHGPLGRWRSVHHGNERFMSPAAPLILKPLLQ